MSRPLTPETLACGFTIAATPKISPDGTRIAYVKGSVHPETKTRVSQIWLMDRDGSNARALTASGESNGSPCWSPDGASIAFTSDRGCGHGVYLMSLDGGDARRITHHSVPIGGLAWSPDGRALAYTVTVDPANPNEAGRPAGAPEPVRVTRRLDYKEDSDSRGFIGDVRSQLWVVDPASGSRRQLTHEPFDHTHPQWSPDGKTIAVTLPNRNYVCSQLALIDVATGARTLVGDELGVVETFAWSLDGARIIFTGEPERTFQNDFFVYTVATGEVRRLTDDLQCLPEWSWSLYGAPSRPVWLDGSRVLFHAVHAAKNGFYTIDVETGAVTLRRELEAATHGFSVDRAGRYAVQSFTSLDRVGDVAVYDLQTDELQIVTDHNSAVLKESPQAEWETFQIERGGLTIDAWLLKPPGFDPAKRYPLIIDIHGGPNWWYGYDFSHVQQALATAGFLVVYADPRGSTGYGRSFTQAVTKDWGNEDYQDLMAVVDKVLERPYADPERTGIYGYSYGGFMTSWTIGHTDRFKAAVCGAPAFDLASFYGTSDIGHFWGVMQFGGRPHEAREWYDSHNPAKFAHRTTTPTLILHGEADVRCPIGQGEQMFTLLADNGCEVEFVRYPNSTHLFLWGGEPAYLEDYLTRTLGWFKRYLGDPV
jgi:dipeptidyl aminopeptidase/acylaminoacyl peptidase